MTKIKKKIKTEADNWVEAEEIFIDYDPDGGWSRHKAHQFARTLIKNNLKFNKSIKKTLLNNSHNQMYLIFVSSYLADKNLATDDVVDEIWRPFFLNELDIYKKTSARKFLNGYLLDNSNYQVAVIMERLTMRHAIDIIKPIYNSWWDKWIIKKYSEKIKKYINTHKPIKDFVNQIRYSKDKNGKKDPGRTAYLLHIAYPNWNKNKKFFVKKENLHKKKNFY